MVPVKETSASLSMPSSWMLSLSDLELPLDLFMLRKYWPHLCRPASFFSLFSLARLFWNQTWRPHQTRSISGRATQILNLFARFAESPPEQLKRFYKSTKALKYNYVSRTVSRWPSLKVWKDDPDQDERGPLQLIYCTFNSLQDSHKLSTPQGASRSEFHSFNFLKCFYIHFLI